MSVMAKFLNKISSQDKLPTLFKYKQIFSNSTNKKVSA